jgi:hypothetical protein
MRDRRLEPVSPRAMPAHLIGSPKRSLNCESTHPLEPHARILLKHLPLPSRQQQPIQFVLGANLRIVVSSLQFEENYRCLLAPAALRPAFLYSPPVFSRPTSLVLRLWRAQSAGLCPRFAKFWQSCSGPVRRIAKQEITSRKNRDPQPRVE